MSEAKRFIKSGIMLTVVGLAMRTVAMFFGGFISRTVGAEGTGLYTLVMTVYSFAITFATSGISLTVTRLVASRIGEGKANEVFDVLRGAFIFSLMFGIAATAGLFFGADIIGRVVLSDERTITSLRVLALSLVPAALSATVSGYFVGVKRIGFNALTSVMCQILRVGLTTIIVIYLSPYGIVSAVVGLCIGTTVTEIIGFALFFFEFLYDWRKNGKKEHKKTNAFTSVSRTALPLAFSAYVRSLLLNVEHILIPKKLQESGEGSAEAYAQYGTLHGMALPLVVYPMSPLSSFASMLVPEFAEDMSASRWGRINRMASKATNMTLAYAIMSAVFLYVFSEELGYVIYDSYEAGYFISTLSIVVPIMYLDHVTDFVLKGIGEQVFSMWINITDSLLSVFLVWLLIPRMGIMGYALVIIIMEAYNFILSFLRLRRKIKFTIKPLSAIVAPLVISIFSAYLSRSLFVFCGSNASPLWLTMKMLFATLISLTIFALLNARREFYLQKSKVKI